MLRDVVLRTLLLRVSNLTIEVKEEVSAFYKPLWVPQKKTGELNYKSSNLINWPVKLMFV